MGPRARTGSMAPTSCLTASALSPVPTTPATAHPALPGARALLSRAKLGRRCCGPASLIPPPYCCPYPCPYFTLPPPPPLPPSLLLPLPVSHLGPDPVAQVLPSERLDTQLLERRMRNQGRSTRTDARFLLSAASATRLDPSSRRGVTYECGAALGRRRNSVRVGGWGRGMGDQRTDCCGRPSSGAWSRRSERSWTRSRAKRRTRRGSLLWVTVSALRSRALEKWRALAVSSEPRGSAKVCVWRQAPGQDRTL